MFSEKRNEVEIHGKAMRILIRSTFPAVRVASARRSDVILWGQYDQDTIARVKAFVNSHKGWEKTKVATAYVTPQ